MTGDGHLGVLYSASVLPPVDPEWEPSPAEVARMMESARMDHFGMPVAEIREGNVGYLVVSSFYPPEAVAEQLAKVMSKLADADVLVIDV